MPRYLVKVDQSKQQLCIRLPKTLVQETNFEHMRWVTLEVDARRGILIRPFVKKAPHYREDTGC